MKKMDGPNENYFCWQFENWLMYFILNILAETAIKRGFVYHGLEDGALDLPCQLVIVLFDLKF